jgi:hypothetical protein
VQPQCDDDQHSTATLAREFESCLPIFIIGIFLLRRNGPPSRISDY